MFLSSGKIVSIDLVHELELGKLHEDEQKDQEWTAGAHEDGHPAHEQEYHKQESPVYLATVGQASPWFGSSSHNQAEYAPGIQALHYS